MSIVVLIVLVDGFVKQNTPGSLLEPARTYLFPSNWLTLPLSFGLLMCKLSSKIRHNENTDI